MIRNLGFHSRGNPRRLVNPAEVVIHENAGLRYLMGEMIVLGKYLSANGLIDFVVKNLLR